MQTWVKRARGSRRGFTLVEIIVVIAIIGILAAVVSPMIISYVGDARENTDKANALALESTIKRLISSKDLTFDASTAAATVVTAVRKELDIPVVQSVGDGTNSSFYLKAYDASNPSYVKVVYKLDSAAGSDLKIK